MISLSFDIVSNAHSNSCAIMELQASVADAVLKVHAQGSAVVVYNWLQREHLSPHTWVTDYMADLHLNVNFVGVSTQDRRFLYPQKEVGSLCNA